MLRAIVVFAPIIAALAWVVFNIQKPAREQFNRDFLGKEILGNLLQFHLAYF